jgi:hypothetical protein
LISSVQIHIVSRRILFEKNREEVDNTRAIGVGGPTNGELEREVLHEAPISPLPVRQILKRRGLTPYRPGKCQGLRLRGAMPEAKMILGVLATDYGKLFANREEVF